jgi:methionine aminopeptidase
MIDKYQTAGKICKKVYEKICDKIQNGEREVKKLCIYGSDEIIEECKNVYKKEKLKGIAIPVCISLNDCLGYYIYEENNEEYNVIKEKDVIKIELGVNIGGCIAILGETICLKPSEDDQKYMKLLDKLSEKMEDKIKAGETNDEVRIMIESKCTKKECFPIENCMSYQQLNGKLKTDDSKYIVLNHTKYWDEYDNLAVEQDICFEFEENEVYNINMTIIPELNEGRHKYKTKHCSHIYIRNEYYEGLRTKSGKEFMNRISSLPGGFYISDYKNTPKDKLGFKECNDKGLLDELSIIYNHEKAKIYHKKFTIIVRKDKCIKF